MTEDRRRAARRVFMEVADLTGADLDAALAEACGADAALRLEVEALLRAEAAAGGFMGAPTSDAAELPNTVATPAGAPREASGERIGRYKLLQPIGEGGFGTVWLAEQKEPVRRRVALKIIKLGMDTKQVIARFEAERQALAMMDHPNIAKVLDAGATEAGRPYFVMELVKGVPVTEYCDTESLTTDERLELFISVCNAAQHAHQKGVIHRDIKPSNVLVTLHDGRPVVKVIDFGIAKAIDRELTDKTLFTEFRQFIGTPEYMSPEQAEMSGLDIDTRSDIYSLGVLLYELLTGVTPFDGKKLRSAALNEIQRIIREDEPPRPSTRLSEAGLAPAEASDADERSSIEYISRHRRTDPRTLTRTLRGDLDWIVMKALEKDRARRYETANGFAMDIRRYLDDEPVTASPPSAAYRLRKLIRRHRRAFAAAAVVFVVLTLGIVGTTWGLLAASTANRDLAATNARLDDALTDAEAQRNLAIENATTARDEAARAERELARATVVRQLITDMFQAVSPEVARGADTELLEGILENAAQRLTSGEITDELVAAELHLVIGDVYRRLGRYEQAEPNLLEACEITARLLGPEHPASLGSMNTLANLRMAQGRHGEAEALLRQVMEKAIRVLGEEDPITLQSMNNLAIVCKDQSRYAEAESLYARTLEIARRAWGDEHPNTLLSMSNVAIVRMALARYEEAESIFKQVLAIQRRTLGDEHPDTVDTVSNLAVLYSQQGRHADAEPLFEQMLDHRRRVQGEEHPDTLNCMIGLANALAGQGRYERAEALLTRSLQALQRTVGVDNPLTMGAMKSLAIVHYSQGHFEEAAPLFRSVLEFEERRLGPENRETLGSITNLGWLYLRTGRFADAAAMFERSLPIKRRVLGAQHPWTSYAIEGLAQAYDGLDRHDDAAPLWREMLELLTARAELPEVDQTTLNGAAWLLLTITPEELRDPERALRYAERASAIEEESGGSSLSQCLDTLALAQHMTGDTEAAVGTQRRAIRLIPDGADPSVITEMHERLAEYEAVLADN